MCESSAKVYKFGCFIYSQSGLCSSSHDVFCEANTSRAIYVYNLDFGKRTTFRAIMTKMLWSFSVLERLFCVPVVYVNSDGSRLTRMLGHSGNTLASSVGCYPVYRRFGTTAARNAATATSSLMTRTQWTRSS